MSPYRTPAEIARSAEAPWWRRAWQWMTAWVIPPRVKCFACREMVTIRHTESFTDHIAFECPRASDGLWPRHGMAAVERACGRLPPPRMPPPPADNMSRVALDVRVPDGETRTVRW